MERNKAILFLSVWCTAFTLGMFFSIFFIKTNKELELQSCYEDYERLARLDDKLSKIARDTCNYMIGELERDLKECRGQ